MVVLEQSSPLHGRLGRVGDPDFFSVLAHQGHRKNQNISGVPFEEARIRSQPAFRYSAA